MFLDPGQGNYSLMTERENTELGASLQQENEIVF